MRYEIREGFSPGVGLIVFELIVTVLIENYLTIFHVIKNKVHPAFYWIILIGVAIVIFLIYASSKIGCIIISLLYSVGWAFVARSITSSITGSDRIWMLVAEVIVFLISLGIHISTPDDSGIYFDIIRK